MAWTAPMTATTGNVLTASQFNQYWRDNLLVSEAALATTAGRLLVSNAAHDILERTPQVMFEGGADSTASLSYVTLAVSTNVAVQTGSWALVSIGAGISNDNAVFGSRVGVDISGATTRAASDTNSYYADSAHADDGYQGTWTTILLITAGLNLFDLRYKAVTGGTATFNRRLLAVVPF